MSNVDTAKWDIDKSYIFPGKAVFYCDAVELSRDSRAKILMLGLGGGLINSYLHYNFPKMSITVVEISATMLYIASKWFGLELDENHRVVVTDGVDFIQEQIKKGNIIKLATIFAAALWFT
ncbi:hypothetical protein OESDEN_22944 [Oesophagostomum dentatum]|uniref:PABS domain-containing protein n=1 Tax=Oesophagostomum dentatum TaxID=61180 RepID=A0A0B1S0K5_OESDE|nr:hypothetical protein OESDEN_22944 [Oesophagostomum dentatum]